MPGYPAATSGYAVIPMTATIATDGRPSHEECRIRIAAAGDIHFGRDGDRERAAEIFGALEGRVDIVLLAGDLTTHGEPEQAAIVADACRGLGVPVVTVLGNHDWNTNQGPAVTEVLEDAGIVVLDRGATTCAASGLEIGVVGTKGFVGGFPGSRLPDFGEPLLRELYAETTAEVDAIASGLQEIGFCELCIVLLHYSPTSDTLHGEPEGIWTYLGCDRLAVPIAEYRPDVVLHGHAHAGSFEGAIGPVPVYNVAVHVTGRDFYVFDLGPHEVEVETLA